MVVVVGVVVVVVVVGVVVVGGGGGARPRDVGGRSPCAHQGLGVVSPRRGRGRSFLEFKP